MSASRVAPLMHVPDSGDPGTPLKVSKEYSEAELEKLVFEHPEVLPIAEIDATFNGLFPICRQLRTSAGPLDALFATPSGMLALAEFKLWRNPEARRKVVGQILDYAKDIAHWSYDDLETRVSERLGSGKHLYRLAAKQQSGLLESAFCDAVSANLKRGRFLLLVVGDGIREGVEQIVQYMEDYARLEFTFGLVEVDVYDSPAPAKGKILRARTLARTEVVKRSVVRVDLASEKVQAVIEGEDREGEAAPDRYRLLQQRYWEKVLDGLQFNDSRITVPRAPRHHNVRFFPLPEHREIWITALLQDSGEDGKRWIMLFVARSDPDKLPFGERAFRYLAEDEGFEQLKADLGSFGDELDTWEGYNNNPRIGMWTYAKGLRPADKTIHRSDVKWMRSRLESFVNAVAKRLNDWEGRQP